MHYTALYNLVKIMIFFFQLQSLRGTIQIVLNSPRQTGWIGFSVDLEVNKQLRDQVRKKTNIIIIYKKIYISTIKVPGAKVKFSIFFLPKLTILGFNIDNKYIFVFTYYRIISSNPRGKNGFNIFKYLYIIMSG